MSSLAHHGVKGQKWGVRRYQNPDGTRTKIGKEHGRETRLRSRLLKYGRSKINDEASYVYRSADLAKINPNIRVKDSNTDIIKKNTTFNRLTDTDEKLDDRLKYVSFTDNDLDWYKEHLEGKHLLDVYKSLRDLKIANGRAVVNYISQIETESDPKTGKLYVEATQKQFDDEAINEAYSDWYVGVLPVKDTELLKKIHKDSAKRLAVVKDIQKAYDHTEGYNKLAEQLSNRIKDAGYDGYADLNDSEYNRYGAEYPLIVLNPKGKLKRKKHIQYSSIGGNMNYIYGNTLVLGDSSYLEHHGVKGQKWGVRRYQNPDGTRTALGKKHYSVEAADVESTRKDIKNIVQKFSKKDKQMFFDDYYGDNKYDKTDKEVAKRFVIKEGQNIVAFIDAETNRYDSDLNMVIGTAQCARGKGYATILSKKMVDWYESEGYENYGSLEWEANTENIGSRKAAENAGFKQIGNSFDNATYFYDKKAKKELDELSAASKKRDAVRSEVAERINSDFKQSRIGKFSPATRFRASGSTYFDYDNERDRKRANLVDSYAERWAKKKHSKDIKEYRDSVEDWSRAYDEYEKKRNKIKHSSIGGNMNYIYGNTLVLGDTSYLEHHGIKNQKWGVRRFQNPDGSLTAAGRIRYGVTGAAKAAFKVGKKLGAATASAAKAGVKKAKDNAYAKKKEKASQTREGVLKNKKMFTADELKALETRFKIEDEMSEASLRHGQAVAKTVSQYANTTRDVLSALQTGGNAVSAITKAFADIQSYQNAKGVAEAAKEKGMTTKEFDLFLKEKYPNAKKDDGNKKKDKNSNKAKDSDTDNNDDDNPPNDGGGGAGSKKQAEYAANRQKAQEAIYAKRKADLDSRESGVKQREDYLNKRQDALVKVSKQRQSEQDARDADLNRRDTAASEREAKLRETAKTAADVMSKLNKRQAYLDDKEAFLNSVEGYRLDTLSEFKKNEEEAARRKKKKVKHSAIGEEMYADYLSEIYDPNYLEHFGTKGMKWGVRRYQNPDGTLTERGRKHYSKKANKADARATFYDSYRGKVEVQKTPAAIGYGIVGAIAAAMVTTNPVTIAAGAAYMAAYSYGFDTAESAMLGAMSKRAKKKATKYRAKLEQDGFQIQNGVLMYGFTPSDELEHFGLKGMKWGVRRFQNKDGSLTEAGKQRYARATARVTTTSSTTNTTDAHNEKLARDRRDKRKQAARASATAKKNRLAGSGRKKYTSGQTSSIGRVGSGRGKTSTRR